MRITLFTFLVVAVASFFLISGCMMDFSDVGAPVWEVEATAPFSERVYRLSELLTDSTEFEEQGWGLFANDNDSSLRFEYFESIDYQEIGDRLTYDGSEFEQGQYTNEIGTIHIEDPPLENNRILINDIAETPFPTDTPVIIPPFEFQEVQGDLQFEVFHWVQVEQGVMTLTITNNYPFPIEDLEVTIDNIRAGNTVDVVQFPDPIPSGGQAQQDVNLTGKTVENELRITSNGRTPGNNNPTTLTGDENMIIDVDISEMDVISANARIGAQPTFDRYDAIEVENDNKISEAVIKTGKVFYRMENTLPLNATIQLEYPNVRDAQGNIFTDEIEMPASGTTPVMEIPLDDKTFVMDIDTQLLEVNSVVDVESTGNNYVTISRDQGVRVIYWSSDMVLHSLTGLLAGEEFEIPYESTTVEIPSGFDGIDFSQVSLEIDLKNNINIPLRLDFDIIGTSENDSETKNVQRDILPGDTTITIRNIDEIVEIIPEVIGVSGTVYIGADYFPQYADSLMSISSEDGFEGAVTVITNLRFKFESTSILTDPVEIEEALDYDVSDVSMRIRVVNTIPLGGEVKLLMGNDLADMDTVMNAIIPRGEIIDFRAVLAETTFTLGLSSEAIEILKRSPIYTQQEMRLFGTDDQTVHLNAADSVMVQASTTAFYTINPNDEEDE